MKKTYVFLAAICLIMSMLISIQSPINMSNEFVLNGNALAENEGFEDAVGMNYEENQKTVLLTQKQIDEMVSETITDQAKNNGIGKGFKIEGITLAENKARNIGAEDKYTEPTPAPTPTPTQKPQQQINTSKGSNILTDFDVNSENVEYLGNFKLTAYCPCYECSEGYGRNTASGAKATANHTIAVDPKVIPYGTTVIIERNGTYYKYTAEDCGGAIKKKKIDIYFDTHTETCNFGVRYGNVYIIK